METSLHRQLKALYGGSAEQQEVWVSGFRIDALATRGKTQRLIEIQSAPLGAIRDKVRQLLEERHTVWVVKPLAARKRLLKRSSPLGEVVSRRTSPLRQDYLHLFQELVNFVNVFPHPRLTLEVLLTEQEEHRVPVQRRRRRGKDYRVTDRLLCGIEGRLSLRTAADLRKLLPAGLAPAFSTADIARQAGIPRWLAQKMAYCLQKTGAVDVVGKQGNAILYAIPDRRKRSPGRAA
jgi:hypothetical protein